MSDKMHVKLNVNGEDHEFLAEPRELLIYALREKLNITGPHVGCETSHYEFWNASLSYRKDDDSKFEYEIKATNLLDTRSQNQSSSSNISVSATEYFIQPRYVTFRVRYEL